MALAALCVLASGCGYVDPGVAQYAKLSAEISAEGEREKQAYRDEEQRQDYLAHHGYHWEQDATIWRESLDGTVYSEPHFRLVKD